MAVLTGNVQRCDAKVVESSHLKYTTISVLLYIFLDTVKLRAIADSTRVCMHTGKGEQPYRQPFREQQRNESIMPVASSQM